MSGPIFGLKKTMTVSYSKWEKVGLLVHKFHFKRRQPKPPVSIYHQADILFKSRVREINFGEIGWSLTRRR